MQFFKYVGLLLFVSGFFAPAAHAADVAYDRVSNGEAVVISTVDDKYAFAKVTGTQPDGRFCVQYWVGNNQAYNGSCYIVNRSAIGKTYGCSQNLCVGQEVTVSVSGGSSFVYAKIAGIFQGNNFAVQYWDRNDGAYTGPKWQAARSVIGRR